MRNRSRMILHYENGKSIEGIALSSTGSTMRVALRGYEDVIELVRVDGEWISEDWEPVRIHPAWRARGSSRPIAEAEFVCPREVAFQLARIVRGESADGKPSRLM